MNSLVPTIPAHLMMVCPLKITNGCTTRKGWTHRSKRIKPPSIEYAHTDAKAGGPPKYAATDRPWLEHELTGLEKNVCPARGPPTDSINKALYFILFYLVWLCL